MDGSVNETSVSLLMKNVTEFGKFSFDLEEKREQSLITQSGHLLTVQSIVSAALLMTLPIIIEHTIVPKNQLLTAGGIVFFPIIISMVLCIIVQWRYSYQTMMNASELREKIQKDICCYPTQAQYDYQWEQQLAAIQNSKKKINDMRVRLIKIAICLLLAAVGLFLASWALFIVLYA